MMMLGILGLGIEVLTHLLNLSGNILYFYFEKIFTFLSNKF